MKQKKESRVALLLHWAGGQKVWLFLAILLAMCSATMQRTLNSAPYAPLWAATPEQPNSAKRRVTAAAIVATVCTTSSFVQALLNVASISL